MTQTLTALESQVFAALKQNAEDVAGGDFGILGELKPTALGLSPQQFGALVTTLQTKGCVTVWGPVDINGGPRQGGTRVTQFTIGAGR